MNPWPTRNCAFLIMALLTLGGTAVAVRPLPPGAHGRDAKITIPATTHLTVKLDQVVSAKTAESAGGFTVTFAEPVKLDGVVVIPAGATGAGLVSKAGQANAQMELNSVFVNGKSYRVTTSPISFTQKSPLRAGAKFTFDLMLSLSVAE
jgi:hypothetical protein